jgi:hypothetical protein
MSDSKESVSMREKLLADSWAEIQKLKTGDDINLVDIANAEKYLMFCTSIYANLSEDKIALDKRRAFHIEEYRKLEDVKSDDRAKRLYDMSDDGQRRIEVEQRLKVLTKLMSAFEERINRIKFEIKKYG